MKKPRKLSPRRRPSNEAEAKFFDMASEEGFDVSKRGWPDFILEREGKIIFVEVKPYAAHPLKADQERILRFLSSHGIPCFKWTPDGGYEEI